MRPPDILAHSDFDPALAWTISVSLALHALAIILVLVVPEEFLRRSPQLVSYTVDLTPGNEVGGTNLGGSGGAKKSAAPPAAKAAAKPPVGPPPPKEVEQKPEPPAPPAPKVDPPKAEKPPEPPKAEKPPEPVKAEPPKPVEKAIAIEKPKVPPKPEKPPEAKVVQPQPKPAALPAEKPKPPVAEKKPQPKPAPAQQAKAVAPKPEAAPAKPGAPSSVAKPMPAAKADGGDDAGKRDQAIAAAVKRRAEAVNQEGAGGGSPGMGGTTGSGPASIGPGVGSGGITKGIEWVMYVRQLEAKIKANWVWTVKDGARVAEVWFQILPSGEVVNAKISKSSGDASFDASAERAVSGSSPLSPPPERYRSEFESDGVLFTFNETESRF